MPESTWCFERHALLGEAVGKIDHQALAGLFGRGEHLAPFGGAHRHRLFAQHVAAGFERRQGQRLVELVGRGDADHIQLFFLQHFLCAGVAPGDVEFVADFFQEGLVEVGGSHDLGARVALVSGNVMSAHSQADHAYA